MIIVIYITICIVRLHSNRSYKKYSLSNLLVINFLFVTTLHIVILIHFLHHPYLTFLVLSTNLC